MTLTSHDNIHMCLSFLKGKSSLQYDSVLKIDETHMLGRANDISCERIKKVYACLPMGIYNISCISTQHVAIFFCSKSLHILLFIPKVQHVQENQFE